MHKKYAKFYALERSGFDRRSGEDRRRLVSLDYLVDKPDRRVNPDRRTSGEPRKGWRRYNKWSSIYVGADE